jgi:hypothetical protein
MTQANDNSPTIGAGIGIDASMHIGVDGRLYVKRAQQLIDLGPATKAQFDVLKLAADMLARHAVDA